LGSGRDAVLTYDSNNPVDQHYNNINVLTRNSSLNIDTEHDEKSTNINPQNNSHYNSHQTSNHHQLANQIINYENKSGIENYNDQFNHIKHSPHTQDKSATTESYTAYSSLHPSHNTNNPSHNVNLSHNTNNPSHNTNSSHNTNNMNEVAHNVSDFSRSNYSNKNNHTPSYNAPDHTNQQQINEGKVIAHIEGLNAADWNWDAEDPLDHNLFSFLLDHPIIHDDPNGNTFPE